MTMAPWRAANTEVDNLTGGEEVAVSSGRKLAPAMEVLLDLARSAEPPHSSGRTAASALMVSPDAFR